MIKTLKLKTTGKSLEDLLKGINEITWGKNKDIASIKPYLSTKVVKVKRNGPFPKQNIQNT